MELAENTEKQANSTATMIADSVWKELVHTQLEQPVNAVLSMAEYFSGTQLPRLDITGLKDKLPPGVIKNVIKA